MPSVGERTVLTMTGLIHGQSPQVEVIESPNTDGHAIRVRATKATPSMLTVTEAFTTPALAQAAVTAWEAMQGQMVTVVDARGQSFTRVVLTRVMPRPPQPMINGSGTGISGSGYLLTVDLIGIKPD